MTIVEELDKKSGRPHRSKNITDALKYAYELVGENSPQNIADAIKKGFNGGSGGSSYLGIETVKVDLTVKSLPSGLENLDSIRVAYRVNPDFQGSDEIGVTVYLPNSTETTQLDVPIMDGYATEISFEDALADNQGVMVDLANTDFTGDIELVDNMHIEASGAGSMSIAWIFTD